MALPKGFVSHVQMAEDIHGIMPSKTDFTWVVVKRFSIKIIATDDGVSVDIYASGCHECGPMTGAYCSDSVAKQLQRASPAERLARTIQNKVDGVVG